MLYVQISEAYLHKNIISGQIVFYILTFGLYIIPTLHRSGMMFVLRPLETRI